MTAYVGIDLGTTFSGVVVSSGGDTQVVRDPISGLAKFPTAVYYPEGATDPLVGAAASSEAILDGRLEFLAQEFKRQMGSAQTFRVSADRAMTAEQLSTEVLRRCRAMALQRLPSTALIDIRWTISVPAKFGEPAKAATVRSAHGAGIPQETLSLVLEPEAAAITAYLNRRIRIDNEQYVILFDFGGGTLDIVLMQRASTGLDPVVVDGGDARLGGIDIDKAIADLVLQKLGPEGSVAALQTWSSSDRIRLMREVEGAKRALCGSRGTGALRRFNVQVAHTDRLTMIPIESNEFRQALAPLLESAKAALVRTLELAWQRRSVATKDVAWVLLTGGSSQLLGIEEMVREVFGPKTQIAMPDDPWESIARGACMFAEDPHIVINKISGDSYGVAISRQATPGDAEPRTFLTSYGAKMTRFNSIFFLRGQRIPVDGIVRTYSSVEDFQTEIGFTVLRGDAEDPEDCDTIGKLILSIPSVPHGYPVRCSFRIDEGNRLRVTAWDPAHNQRVEAHVDWAPAELVGRDG